MSPPAGSLASPDDLQQAAIRRALAHWREHRQPGGAPVKGRGPATALPDAAAPALDPAVGLVRAAGDDIVLVEVELLVRGRPGILDVVAEIDGRMAHAVLGLRRPGDELHLVGQVDEPALGLAEDDAGMAVVVDALHDADAARALLDAVAGAELEAAVGAPDRARRTLGPRDRGAGRPAGPGRLGATGGRGSSAEEVVMSLAEEDEVATLGFGHRCSLSVFPWLRPRPHPGVALLVGLDEVGFNHLAAPLAVWRRAGRDLGVVQEPLSGASGGWALAQASLRDLFGAGGPPESAGADFAAEARALGTMVARLHIALDRAFGRRSGDVAAWAAAAEADLLAGARAGTGTEEARGAPAGTEPDGLAGTGPDGLAGTGPDELAGAVAALRATQLHPPALRTHGDLTLARTARTDHGWVLADTMPGGADPVTGEPHFRSPLADVADMLWSLHHAAQVAVAERGTLSSAADVHDLAAAWETRNRRTLVASYLSTPGIGGLVPGDRDTLRRLVAVLEAARSSRRAEGSP